MDAKVEIRSQASAVVDDFDAALAVAVQQVTALALTQPTVTIQPCQPRLLAGDPTVHFHVCVSGAVEPVAVEAVA